MTDEDQIREMLALWAKYDAEKDARGWSELFTPDGKYVGGRRDEYVGRETIRKNLEDRTAKNPPERRTTHILGPSIIKIDGNTAETETQYAAMGHLVGSPWQFMSVGSIVASLVRQDGKWLFTEVRNEPK